MHHAEYKGVVLWAETVVAIGTALDCAQHHAACITARPEWPTSLLAGLSFPRAPCSSPDRDTAHSATPKDEESGPVGKEVRTARLQHKTGWLVKRDCLYFPSNTRGFLRSAGRDCKSGWSSMALAHLACSHASDMIVEDKLPLEERRRIRANKEGRMRL